MPTPTHRLSKSRYLAGLHCPRRLWLTTNRPNEKRPPTPAELHRMHFGTDFGRKVTHLFPNGIEITADYTRPQQALDDTAARLAGDAPTLFEAAFLHHDVLVRVDVLNRSTTKPNAWDLIEVKSGSNSAGNKRSRKPKLAKHIPDMAVQLHVLEGAGLAVESIHLAWVNSKYQRVGDLDWQKLVAIEDHSSAVRTRAAQVGGELDGFLAMIDEPAMPEAAFQKSKCGECEFSHICWGDEPEDSVIYLPRLSAGKRDELAALGVARIPDIPSDFELTPSQAAMLEAYDHPDGHVAQPKALAQWIAHLEYPLHYFDFEAWNPCIPPFDKTRPYVQIPFQYSLHTQSAPGAEPSHREFLAPATGDPRPALIEQLVADLGATTGSIVVHFAAFEKARIRELADFSPAHKDALLPLLDRIVDTEIPFKKNWVLHPGLMGRSSIKVVLPTLVPDLSYEGMAIADGLAAAISFEDMYEEKVVGEAAEAVRANLREYCRLDTLAMVRIVDELRGLAL